MLEILETRRFTAGPDISSLRRITPPGLTADFGINAPIPLQTRICRRNVRFRLKTGRAEIQFGQSRFAMNFVIKRDLRFTGSASSSGGYRRISTTDRRPSFWLLIRRAKARCGIMDRRLSSRFGLSQRRSGPLSLKLLIELSTLFSNINLGETGQRAKEHLYG